jgi:tetratricopeptide (TPR) repeat protein
MYPLETNGDRIDFRLHLNHPQEGRVMRYRRKWFQLSPLSLILTIACIPAAFAELDDSAASAPNVPGSRQVHALPPEIEGDVLMLHRRYEAAIHAYQRESNRTAVLLNKIGLAYHHMFAFDEAGKYYQQALAINPHFPEALNNMGAVYYSHRNFAQAERTYREALKYQPQNALMLRNLGLSYFADHKNREGTEAYRQALTADPNIFERAEQSSVEEGGERQQLAASNYSMAKLCAAAGKTHEALGFLQKAHQAGFHDRKQLMKDNDLTGLRSTPEFQQIMLEHTADK